MGNVAKKFCQTKASKQDSVKFSEEIDLLRELSKQSLEASRNGVGQAEATPRQLFAFDFDMTVARYHMWGTYQNKPVDSIPIADDTFADLAAFRDFVDVVTKLGHHVAIATFGRKEVVNKAMVYAFGDNHDIIISTPADHGHKEGSSSLGDKNIQLQALAQHFGVTLQQIVFFDDDPNNVKRATAVGVTSYHTAPPHALTKQILASASNALRTETAAQRTFSRSGD